MEPEFLNVDLEVFSRHDLSPLVEALEGKVSVLYRGKQGRSHLATFEVQSVKPSVPQALTRFCDLLESLPPDAKRVWRNASRRIFDIGMRSGQHPPALMINIPQPILLRIVKLEAAVGITLYPTDL